MARMIKAHKIRLSIFLLAGMVALLAVACAAEEAEPGAPAQPAPAAPAAPAPSAPAPAPQAPGAPAPAAPALPGAAAPAAPVPGQVVPRISRPAPLAPAPLGEAPMLAALVAAGTLPPLDQRIPSEPLVIDVVDEIGQYGGTMQRAFTGARDTCNYTRLARAGLTRWSSDGFELRPNVAKSWESNDDGTVWTVKLREGTKWSDGAPFTADDFVYQYEEVVLNPDLLPNPPKWINAGGKVGKVEKIDNLTVQFTYDVPFFVFPQIVSEEPCSHTGSGQPKNAVYAPAHYLKQFHIKFNPDADALAQAEGLASWVQLYVHRSYEANNPDVPTMRPWITRNDSASQLWVAERNPYYYGVDPKGNQLPYIDRIEWQLIEDREVIQVKAASGEIDFQYRHIQTPKYPVFKGNEAKAGIQVKRWGTAGTVSESALFFNQSFQGAEGDILRNKKFRQALSVAINRDEINEISYLGLAEPRQTVPPVGHPHSPGAEYVFKWTQYDPDLANQMLDEVLPNKDSEGFRLMPNGDRLLLVLTDSSGSGDVSEQVGRDWQAVGVKVKVDLVARATLTTRHHGNEFHIIRWSVDTGCCIYTEPGKLIPVEPTHLPTYAPLYAQWWIHDRTGLGDVGIEPPDDIKELQSLWEQGQVSDPVKAAEIAQELYRRIADNVWVIGTVGLGVRVVVADENMRNLPEFAVMDWPFRGPSTAYPEQFYFTNQ